MEQFQQAHRKLVSELDEKLAAGENTTARLKAHKKFFTNLSNLTIQVGHPFSLTASVYLGGMLALWGNNPVFVNSFPHRSVI